MLPGELPQEPVVRSQRVQPDDLSSEKGMDYAPLQKMLQTGQWKKADQETLRVMCAAMGRQKEGWLRVEDIERFPCADLRTIDQLWVKYSNGKWGFSVQKQIWQECGSPMSYNDDWKKFCDRVGWRKKGRWLRYDNLTFDLDKSETGEFPPALFDFEFFCFPGRSPRSRRNPAPLRYLFSRAETCEL